MKDLNVLWAWALCFLLIGCAGPEPVKRFTESWEFFGSVVRLDVCYESSQKSALDYALAEVWARFADIHSRLSVYDPASDMNRINHSFPAAVTIGADTWTVIREAVYYNQLSGGEFDITIYPLLKLWKDSEKKGVLPTGEQIRILRDVMGSDKFEILEKNQVRLLNPATQLTIDSIGDGYAADEAVRILRAHGLSNFLVDTSGELYASGQGCPQGVSSRHQLRPWRVGINDPRDPLRTTMVEAVYLENMAVTTSGNYEHFYTIDSNRYSHVISPLTGFPRDEIVSATVIAPSTQFSDFLSTALCLMLSEKGLALIDSLGEGYAGMILVDDGKGKLVRKTSRYYGKYLLK